MRWPPLFRPLLRSPRVWALGAVLLGLAGGQAGLSQEAQESADTHPLAVAAFQDDTTGGPVAEPGGILFVGGETRTDIYIADADGTNPVRLTPDAVQGTMPVWSPDGKRIAFLSRQRRPFGDDLWVMNADGTGARKVETASVRYPRAPAWSPDGRYLLVPGGCGGIDAGIEGLALARADGSGASLAVPVNTCVSSAAWSPDGKAIVAEYDQGIFRFEVQDGVLGQPQALWHEEEYFPQETMWSPDGKRIALGLGKRIALSSGSGGWYGLTIGLYLMNADGTGLAPVEGIPPDLLDERLSGGLAGVRWSPRGDQLAFVARTKGEESLSLWIVGVQGGNLRRLADRVSVGSTRLEWSPDGQHIAVTLAREGNLGIYIIKVDGSGLARLTDSLWADYAPAWSPDGRRIAFTTERHSSYGIYRVRPDGSGLVRLTDGPPLQSPVLSPHGQRIAASIERAIVVANLDGSEQLNLTNSREVSGLAPIWSPDGSMLAFFSYDVRPTPPFTSFRGIEAIDSDGSDQRVLWEGLSRDLLLLGWLPDSSGVCFFHAGPAARGGRRAGDVYCVGLDGGEPVNLTSSGDVLGGVASLDGSGIIFLAGRDPNEPKWFSMSADGNERRELFQEEPDLRASGLAFSPDGSWVAAVSGDALYVVRPDGSEVRELSRDFWTVPWLTWSPDGQQIAFKSGEPYPSPGYLHVVNVDGSEERRLSDLSVSSILGWLAS